MYLKYVRIETRRCTKHKGINAHIATAETTEQIKLKLVLKRYMSVYDRSTKSQHTTTNR